MRRTKLGLLALVPSTMAVTVAGTLAGTVPARADVTGNVVVTGHGYGHGRGLGQWGAYGYAVTEGWSYTAILAHYYGGTTLGDRGNPAVTVDLTAQDGRDLTVTSGAPFHAGGVAVAAGSAARVVALADGTFHLYTSFGCGKPEVWDTPIPNGQVTSDVAAPVTLTTMLTVCEPSLSKQYRGQLAVLATPSGERTVNTVPMEDYLRGVVPRESPASWADAGAGRGIEALKAQAVAARSYAAAESRTSYAQTCDSPSCQVYGGAGTNGTGIEDARSDAAVAATAGQILQDASGKTVRAEFSASTGGWTAGGQFPAVADDGDASSPYHDWSVSIPAATVAAAFGVGTLQDIAVTARNGLGADGGRVTSVQIRGSAGTVTRTGDQVRIALGLRSTWFSVGVPSRPAPQPVLYEGAGNATGVSAQALPLGSPGDTPLNCDWNGDGVDTPAVFRAGTWYLTNVPGSTAVATSFAFGQAGDQPVCGDWNGDGTDTPGVYRNGVVYLRNSDTTGKADVTFPFGNPGDTLVAGKWRGGPVSTVGVWRRGVFFLSSGNQHPVADRVLAYGNPTDRPVTGDWNGDGVDTVGVYRGDTFYLRNGTDAGPADLVVVFGAAGDTPAVGRWKAGAPDTVGVARYF